jgi:hypothetical protein
MRTLLRACALAVLVGAPAAQADTLLIHAIEQERELQRERPPRGVTMAHVEQRFGAPQDRLAAVGEPPITRWVYPGYTVVFEYDRVLHSVTHR